MTGSLPEEYKKSPGEWLEVYLKSTRRAQVNDWKFTWRVQAEPRWMTRNLPEEYKKSPGEWLEVVVPVNVGVVVKCDSAEHLQKNNQVIKSIEKMI